MRFSVIVPTCDRPALLRACLARLAPGRQTLAAEAYEVIVTDDGAHAVEPMLAPDFPWVLWTRGPRRGPAANRNHGASLARGEWLAFTDDDCLPEPQWLAAFATQLGSAPHAVIWEGRTFSRTADWGPLHTAPINESGGKFWSCNLLVACTAFRALGGFDVNFPFAHLEDVDFQRRAEAAGLARQFCPAAAVEHPPRPVGSVIRQARAHSSYFYFARKHGVSLAEAGLSARAFLRWRLTLWRSSRTAGESLRYLARCVGEAACLTVLIPWWTLSGRPRA